MNIKSITIITIFLFVPVASFYVHGYLAAPNKEKIMNYPMPNIIKRCQKDFGYTDEDMVILEHELKRYLILCSMKEFEDLPMNMYSEDVDNLWHTFILFTKEYAEFCNKNVGYFIHHVPTLDSEHKQPEEFRNGFHTFITSYEKIFNEDPHPVWFLNACEKLE